MDPNDPRLDECGELAQETPDFRATVTRSGTVRIVPWTPWLTTSGPLHTLFLARARARVTIADLTVLRDDADNASEVVVDFMCEGAAEHRERLCDWAAYAGYQRMWFDDELIELEPKPGGRAQTRCSGCRARLLDGKDAFWRYVRQVGAFPTSCPLCGSDLAQWYPAEDPVASPRSGRGGAASRSRSGTVRANP